MSVEDEMMSDLINIRDWVVDLEGRLAKEIEDILCIIDKTIKIYDSKANLKAPTTNEHAIADFRQRLRDVNSDRSIY